MGDAIPATWFRLQPSTRPGDGHHGWLLQSDAAESAGQGDWIVDSLIQRPRRLPDASLRSIESFIDDSGDCAAAGQSPEGTFLLTDSMGTRPVFRGMMAGREIFSTRISLMQGCEGAVPLRGNTTVKLSGSSIAATSRPRPSPGRGPRGLARALEDSVRRRLEGRTRVAVSFSGGLDSSLLALLASRVAEVRLFTVCTPSAPDRTGSREAASLLGLPWTEVIVDEGVLSAVCRSAPSRMLWKTPMDYAIAGGFEVISKAAARVGHDLILAGQGADELFGGYSKYARAGADPKLMLSSMESDVDVLYVGVARDAEAIREGGCSPCFPYLDPAVVSTAKSLEPDERVDGTTTKVALRQAAKELGLPARIAERRKKAFQYSSGTQKLVRSLFFKNRGTPGSTASPRAPR